jgi:hypothetical protein
VSTLHGIRWEFNQGSVDAKAVCNAEPGADCRLSCPEGCEQWGRLVDKDGEQWHTIPGGTIPIHRMEVVPYCNVQMFLDVDSYDLLEMYEDGHEPFVIAETPIEPVWDRDGYLWRRIRSEVDAS